MTYMNAAEKLHTYARRYCMERFDYWTTKYSKLAQVGGDRVGTGYTDKAYSMFPRYNVLSAMLREIETIDYEQLPTIEKLVELLELVGECANSIFTENLENEIAIAATENERELFIAEVTKIAASGLGFVEPLYYRRALNKSEVSNFWKSIEGKWGANRSYWYPLNEKTHPSLIALGISDLDQVVVQKRIQSFLKTRNVDRVIELREFGTENYLIDTIATEFIYRGEEGYWISDANDWIIYCSHESTITLGGEISSIHNQLRGPLMR